MSWTVLFTGLRSDRPDAVDIPKFEIFQDRNGTSVARSQGFADPERLRAALERCLNASRLR